MADSFHMRFVSDDDLIDEVQRRGMTVTPGGGEVARGEIVVRSDDESERVRGLSIREWQEKIHTWAVGKGWWDDENPNVPEKLMLMVSELAEALEDYRNGKGILDIWFEGDGGKPCGFPTEIADTAIRILDFCGHFGIDLESVMLMKHAYNVDRPVRHGGKVC